MTTHAEHTNHRHRGPAEQRLADLREPTKALRSRVSDVYDGFLKMTRTATADGEMPAKYKELVALAIAVAVHCDGCIDYHARAAARRGATEQEAAEALGVTVLMGGGPSASDYAPRAFEAFREFANGQRS